MVTTPKITPTVNNDGSAPLALCNEARAYSVGPRFSPLPALTPYAEKLLARAESVVSAMLPAPAPTPKRNARRVSAARNREIDNALATVRARPSRAFIPRAPMPEGAELKARRVRGETDKGHAGMTIAGRAARVAQIAARAHTEMLRDTSHPFPLSAQTVLAKGRALHWREGESVALLRARIAQPSGDTEAQAMRARAHSLAPHLSPIERAALDAHMLAAMQARRALAHALASIQAESKADTRELWTLQTLTPHLSPRECERLHKLNVARRKRAARADWNARDMATRHKARAYVVNRLRLARALQIERACDAMAGACAGQRARFHAFGAVVLKEKESGARIGRKAARVIAPASGQTKLDATQGGEFEIDARDGTGRTLDAQCVEEMRLAARAVFLSGGTWKEANNAAYLTLSRALRDDNGPDTHAKAARTMDRNWKRAQAEFAREAGQYDESAESAESVEMQWARECYISALRGMRCVVAYWMSSKSPYRFRGVRDDIASIRAHAGNVFNRVDMAGMRAIDRKAKKRNAEYMDAHRLGERVEAGAEILKERARWQARGEYLLARSRAERLAPLIARGEHKHSREMQAQWDALTRAFPRCADSTLAAAQRAQRALIVLPVGRAENEGAQWRERLRKRTLPALALRLCGALTHGSARGTDKRAGRESARKAHTRKAQSVMRAPLPEGARAALDALTA